MSDPKKIKGDLRVEGNIKVPNQTASRALAVDASGNITSTGTTTAELAHLQGVTSSIQTQINDVQQDIDDHIADTTDAHDASAISNVPSGNLTATDVQGALNELQSDIDTRALASDLTDHLNDATDAHDASAISNVPSGNLTATDVQGALNELQSDIDGRIPTSEKGVANGVATLDGSGKVPVSQLPNAIMEYQGTYDASTNTPTLTDGPSNPDTAIGNVYRVNVAGTVNLGSGNISLEVGDYLILNVDKIWEKADTTDAVSSFNGRTGAIDPENGDYTASQITNVPSGNLTSVTVQAALNELQSDVDTRALASDLTDHLNDTTDAHAASAISNTPAGTISSTTVQAAINELDGDIQGHITDTTDAHAASAISVTPSGNLSSTDVQAALVELQGDIDALAPSDGDISETSFSLANNQATPANVTGLSFSATVVRSFSALVSVEIDATSDLFEQFTLEGINRGPSGFSMSVSSVGDESGVVFSITSSGQVQYTSSNYAGFVSGSIKFRAITTSV
jgi:predicted FMN-binding regulatory protein PaiB